MNYSVTFTDNQEITDSMLNAIRSELGENVSVSTAFVPGQAYHVDKLNDIRREIVTAGVLNGMQCSLIGGEIEISPGIACFSNGMRLKTEAGGDKLPLIPGVKNYVYLYQSQATQMAMPIAVTEAKENVQGDGGVLAQEYIPLCEADGGIVTDQRKWGKSLIALNTGNLFVKSEVVIPENILEEGSVIDLGNNGINWINGYRYKIKVHEIAIPHSSFNFAYFTSSKLPQKLNGVNYSLWAFYNYDAGVWKDRMSALYQGAEDACYYFEKSGNKILVWQLTDYQYTKRTSGFTLQYSVA